MASEANTNRSPCRHYTTATDTRTNEFSVHGGSVLVSCVPETEEAGEEDGALWIDR